MKPPTLRPSLLRCCLLLVFMATPVAATFEEGTILKNWLLNITSASNSLASWANPTDPCNTPEPWYGVSCEGGNNIMTINLYLAYIVGPLVPELGQLSYLTSLNLYGNTFYGPIPEEFGNLSALSLLVLSSNYLNSTIPLSLGKLTNLETLNLDNNLFSGPIPEEFGNLSVLINLDLSRNFLTGSIPTSLGKLMNLQFLSLSNNALSGSITRSFSDFTALVNTLQEIDLSSNNFSVGSYPESLATFRLLSAIYLDSVNISGVLNVSQILELPNTTSMELIVSLMNNSITNVSLEVGSLKTSSTINLRLQGNPICDHSSDLDDSLKNCFCQDDYCFWPNYSHESHKKFLKMIIGIICGIIFLLAIFLGVIIMRLARRKTSKLEDEYKQKFAELEVIPQPFLYKVLRVATSDFNESTKLGQGGFGTVYKGILLNGNEVAIKKLKPRLAEQGEVDDFLNEVSFITKMKHPNLVNLKGYCIRGKERMLVYEYVENMDVEQSLLMGKNMEAMIWTVRFNICLGVAQGLHYLHEVATPRVIHRDIKASNILLGAQYEPKIGDFGLALLFPDNETHISLAMVAGTKGYLAPEYACNGQLSEKSDVYSFGVLCLEIVSGRKNKDESKPPDQVYLATWAWSLYEKKSLKDLIDPSLHLRAGEVKKALRLINIALSCLQQFPQMRPSMNDVQSAMQGNMTLDEVEPYPMKEMITFESILEETSLLSPLSIDGTGQSA